MIRRDIVDRLPLRHFFALCVFAFWVAVASTPARGEVMFFNLGMYTGNINFMPPGQAHLYATVDSNARRLDYLLTWRTNSPTITLDEGYISWPGSVGRSFGSTTSSPYFGSVELSATETALIQAKYQDILEVKSQMPLLADYPTQEAYHDAYDQWLGIVWDFVPASYAVSPIRAGLLFDNFTTGPPWLTTQAAGYSNDRQLESFFHGSDIGIAGLTPQTPLLPGSVISGEDGTQYVFTMPPMPHSLLFYDPPMARGFEYEASGGAYFTKVNLPVLPGGPSEYLVTDEINGVRSLAAGAWQTFPTPVSSFTVTGIAPPVDPENPRAFPTGLSMDQGGMQFTMTSIPVPEPNGYLLASLCGLSFLPAARRWFR